MLISAHITTKNIMTMDASSLAPPASYEMETIKTFTNETVVTGEKSSSSSPPSGFILQLFQMVNSAPTDIISWSPKGDSFIIGSDLKKLENEVLPVYFRHSRFSSLIRQLNFYAFRKINRERTVWVYQHPLFRKDRPQDLHMIRRRSCPGVDGRKKRIVRISAGALRMGTDSPTHVAELGDEAPVLFGAMKTPSCDRLTADSRSSSYASYDNMPSSDAPMVVDSVTTIEEYDGNSILVNPEEPSVPHATIVTDVANQLAKYVRTHELNSCRKLSGRGIVTPQVGLSRNNSVNSRTFLTYDDELEDEDDASFAERELELLTPPKPMATSPRSERKVLDVPAGLATRIVDQMMSSSESVKNDSTGPCLAEFFLQDCPGDANALCDLIHRLFLRNNAFRQDFEQYRKALHPATPTALWQNWFMDDGFKRSEVLRDFTTYAANVLKTVLETTRVSSDDQTTLKLSIDNWMQNIHVLV